MLHAISTNHSQKGDILGEMCIELVSFFFSAWVAGQPVFGGWLRRELGVMGTAHTVSLIRPLKSSYFMSFGMVSTTPVERTAPLSKD